MRKLFILTMALVALALPCRSTVPDCHSERSEESLDMTKTLRLNYIFSGNASTQEITLAELCSIDGWAGRRVNLDEVPVKGNGQLTMSVGDKVVYRTSFSTLFQNKFCKQYRMYFPRLINRIS